MFEEGRAPASILRQLRRDHMDARDEQDRAEFWPAVALAQWECGGVPAETLAALRRVIERGDGMDAWRAESTSDARKRERALSTLLNKVSRKNPRPRQAGKKQRERPPFPFGACVAFRFPDGRWGAFVAMKAVAGWGHSNFIKLLDYRAAEKPTMAVFIAARWLHARAGAGRAEDPMVIPLMGKTVKAAPQDYEQIGRIKLARDNDYESYNFILGSDLGKIVAQAF
jgi:hypothetical protein